MPDSGSHTPGSGRYTLQAEISSSSGVRGAPLSSSEMGYDVCPSSDFTDLTRITTESQMVMPITHSSDTISDVASEKYVTVSMGRTEFLTAVVPAKSPRQVSPETAYITATTHSQSSWELNFTLPHLVHVDSAQTPSCLRRV